ncbi:MAG: lasso RiPP family leader peptide-containing protein [Vicinamibacterales bacterium]
MADAAHSQGNQKPHRQARWQAPELTEYGSIAKLTQSGGATRIESGVPRMKMNCL